MILDPVSWLFIVAVAILLVAFGGLLSSLYNRRELRRLGLKVDHTNRNAKMVKIALDHFNDKQMNGQKGAGEGPFTTTGEK